MPVGSIAFNYLGSGAEFHLYPSDLKGSTLTIPLTHFSGYGAGQGNAADNQNNTPTSAESQAEQLLAGIFKAQDTVGRDTGGYNLDQLKQIAEILDQWYAGSLGPNAKAGETDEARLDAAASEYAAWGVWIDKFMGSDPSQSMKEIFSQVLKDKAAALDSLAKGFNNAIDKAYHRCVDNKNVLETRTMIKWASAAEKLGVPFDKSAADTKVRKCATFELDFRSEFSGTTALGGNIQSQVHSRFKFSWTVNEVAPLAEGLLEYDNVSISPNPPNRDCSAFAFSPRGSTFQILFLRIIWDLNVLQNPSQDKRIEMPIDPGRPSENVSVN